MSEERDQPPTRDKLAEAQAEIERLKSEEILPSPECDKMAMDTLQKQLAEANAEIERLGNVIESRHASFAKRMDELNQQLASARSRSEKAERDLELCNEIYGGNAAAFAMAMRDRTEAAEARVKELEGIVMAKITAKLQIMPHETIDTLAAELDKANRAIETLNSEWKKDIAERNRLEHALKIIKDILQPLATQEASPEMLAANAASELRRLRAVNAERVNDLAAIEQHAKVVGQLQDRHAAALGYCKRHNHSGVDKAAHCYLNRVIEILEGQQPADLPAAR